MKRLQYHFEPKKGWMNDPNGLIFYKNRYHAFFQHFPDSIHNGIMSWGHAVSDDLISWTELPIALSPDMPYENSGGCWSGTAIVRQGRLYLFYASVSHELGQTVSMAYSDDGVTFIKHKKNPIISAAPDGSPDFRDPKVFMYGNEYQMIVGSGKDGIGRLQRYKSSDLISWKYAGVFLESADFGPVTECPDFFELDGKYVLMFSKMGVMTQSTRFISGEFDGNVFTPEVYSAPEYGPEFYAPQTFEDGKGRRIIIGWLYRWGMPSDENDVSAGALSIPRELHLINGKVVNYPVSEAAHLLSDEDPLVDVKSEYVTIGSGERHFTYKGKIDDVKTLRDSSSVEVFINNGEASFSLRF